MSGVRPRLLPLAAGLLAALVAGVRPASADPEALVREAEALGERGWKHAGDGDYDLALPLLERSLELHEQARGPDHPEVAAAMLTLADVLQETAAHGRALALCRRALSVLEAAHGPVHEEVAQALNHVGLLQHALGDYGAATAAYERSLRIYEQVHGETHPYVAAGLNNLAGLQMAKGRRREALPLIERSLAILEAAYGETHLDVARVQNNLAVLHNKLASYDRACELAERSLAIRRELLEPDHPDIADSLSDLAGVYRAMGRLGEALPLYERALAVLERAHGESHPSVGAVLTNLARLLSTLGDLERALRLQRRGVSILEDVFGPDHRHVATAIAGLAAVLELRGDHARAEPLYERCLRMRVAALGEDHPRTASVRVSLALFHERQGHSERAAPLLERALAGLERAVGGAHPRVADALEVLANVRRSQGRTADAVRLAERALDIRHAALGEDHPRVADSLAQWGELALVLGDTRAAAEWFSGSLAIREAAFGPNHLKVDAAVALSATAAWSLGDLDPAARLLPRTHEIREAILRPNLRSGNARDQRHLLEQFERGMWRAVSLAAARPTAPETAELAADAVLQFKGRATDAAQRIARRVRRRMALFALVQRSQASLAAAELAGAQAEELSALRAKVERLQRDLAQKAGDREVVARGVSTVDVRRRLEPGTALVEWVRYRPFDPKARVARPEQAYGPARLAALVVRPGRPSAFFALGVAGEVDAAVTGLREAILRRSPFVHRAARRLHRLTLAPLLGALDDARALVLSPDGALHLAPFAALVDEQGRLVVERWPLRYVTSGRDLPEREPLPARAAPIVLADPTFGPRRGDVLEFGPLPGARRKAEALRRVLGLRPERVRVGPAAPEAALRALAGPSLVHVATHGFLLAEGPADPMLRSGLALAGFNTREEASDSADDGVLTALELAGLDLYGTELVVLSACETGVGHVDAGEGVWGLKRALALAGARSQAVTLWTVDDASTEALMSRWYARLRRGEARAEALRTVQVAMARGEVGPSDARPAKGRGARAPQPAGAQELSGWTHPYYWASVVLSGAGGALPASSP